MDYITGAIEDIALQTDKSFKCLLITGARQTGKTEMIRKLFPDRKYVLLDDPFVEEQANENPKEKFQMKQTFCFLFVLLLSLALCACGRSASAPSSTGAASPTTDPSVQSVTTTDPGETLSEEEQLAIWNAVIAESSKEDLTREQALARAGANLELLETCGAELLALELPEADGSWQVTSLARNWLIAYDCLSRDIVDFESQNCNLLLELGTVDGISISSDAVCFSIGGRGFGSQTDYYDVYYLPSGDVKGCIGSYSSLEFEAQDGGWFAKADGDNTIFWQQLGEHLYFVAMHY